MPTPFNPAPGALLGGRNRLGERLGSRGMALAHIHGAGVVHRDIKPANILIDPGGSARLTDFGIAYRQDATALTQTGLVIGTLRYLAPEVHRGEPATPRSDLYALGIVLQECGASEDSRLEEQAKACEK